MNAGDEFGGPVNDIAATGLLSLETTKRPPPLRAGVWSLLVRVLAALAYMVALVVLYGLTDPLATDHDGTVAGMVAGGLGLAVIVYASRKGDQ